MSLQATYHDGLEQKNVQKKLNGGKRCESPKNLGSWEDGGPSHGKVEVSRKSRFACECVEFEKAMRRGYPGGS